VIIVDLRSWPIGSFGGVRVRRGSLRLADLDAPAKVNGDAATLLRELYG
jgi:hypothetical protein